MLPYRVNCHPCQLPEASVNPTEEKAQVSFLYQNLKTCNNWKKEKGSEFTVLDFFFLTSFPFCKKQGLISVAAVTEHKIHYK